MTGKTNQTGKNAAGKTMKHISRVVKWVFIWAIVFGFLCGGVAIGYVSALVQDEPVRSEEEIKAKINENALTGFVYFNDDTLVGQLRGEDRRLATMDEIPQHVKDAFLAIEDDDFYSHIGIDIMSLLRAVKQTVFNEEVQTGGSTLTQQLARNVFLSLDKTYSRKAKEIFLALRLERFLSKDEIFLAYMNKVPFGTGANGYTVHGIKAAAYGIFGMEDLSRLNIAQAAYLAGLPQAPSLYSAFNSKGFDEEGFERAVKRQRLVLERMLQENKITVEQYEEALNFDLRASLAKPQQKAYSKYPYLMQEVERRAAKILFMQKHPELTEEDLNKPENAELLKEIRENVLPTGGYKIYTTIDKTLYEAMDAIAQNPDYFTPDDVKNQVEQIGAVMIDNKTGAILSFIGGRDYYIEQLNHATQMVRQPGSSMKPIAAFLPALESGAIQPASIIDDVPMVMKDGSKGYHLPQNWNSKYHGLITARHALNQSYNIPALKLFNETVGISNAWEFAKRLGITTLTEEDYYAQTGVIGGLKYGVTVEELTNAYSAIANKGIFNDAFMIRKIEDAKGNVIYEHQSEGKQVFSEQTAFLMTDMLRTVITSGTGASIRSTFKHYNQVPVAGKTGSTQNDRDAWFIGFTPDVTVGVWAGYDQEETLTTRLNLPQGPGTRRALNVWSLIMNAAYELKPELFPTKEFTMPDGIVRMTVSSVSGKLPSELTRKSNRLVTDYFNKKYIPTEEDQSLIETEYVTYNGLNYFPNPATPADMVKKGILIKRPTPLEDILKQVETALKSVSSGRRSISAYYPADIGLTAPSSVDPRQDDGARPSPPTGLELLTLENGYKIKFTESPSKDVVGYRLYRSVNGGPFTTRASQNVLSGSDPVAFDYASQDQLYAYYLVAVDVVGNESEPSEIVYSREPSAGTDILFPAPGQTSEQSGEDSGDGIVDENGGENGDNSSEERDRSEPPFAPGSSAPSVPQGVQAEPLDDGSGVKLTWQANPRRESIVRYDIYYSNERNGVYQKIGSSNTTQFTYVSGSSAGWYRVVAVNNNGSSDPSEAVQP